MLISKVKITNIRTIRDVEIELKPLTIFVGPNASGKSTILHAIYWFYLKATKNPSLTAGASDVERHVLNIMSYDDLALNRDLRSNWMGVELAFITPKEILNELNELKKLVMWDKLELHEPSLEKLSIGFKIKRDAKGQLEWGISLRFNNCEIAIEMMYDKLKDTYRRRTKFSRLNVEKYGPYFHLGILDDPLYLDSLLNREDDENLRDFDRRFLYSLMKLLKEYINNRFFLITPLRGVIPMSSDPTLSIDVGYRGENTLKALASALLSYDVSKRRTLGEMLVKWTERFGFKGLNVGLDDGHLRAIYIDHVPIDLALGSHGQRQLITLLTQLIIAPENSVMLIEEPEISLHPGHQALLPLLFADVIKNHNKQIIITTHSSIIPLALSDVVMGSDEYPDVPRLGIDEIAIYHVVRGNDGFTRIERLELTEEGYVKGGIPSFVDVEAKLYAKIMSRLS